MRFEMWIQRLRMFVTTLLRREAAEQDLDDELRFHLEQQVEHNLARGMPEPDARREAMRALGSLDKQKEACRENWAVAALDRLLCDVRYARRTLRRDTGFTTGILLLLTLGIGVNVAVYSIVDSVLFEPLPYREPGDLVFVREALPEQNPPLRAVNALHYLEWRNCGCFESIALVEYVQDLNLAGHGDPRRVPALRVSPSFFTTLGVTAALGRTFAESDGEPGNDNVVVISDALWRGTFAADPDIVGKSVSLDAVELTVVGVLPPAFRNYVASNPRVDVYRPWIPTPLPWLGWNNNYSLSAVGRLAEGTSVAAALDEMNAIQAAIAAEHFDAESAALGLGAALTPLHEWVTGRSRDGLYLLLAAVGAAFLVACFNMANLMLVRATARSREAGVRAALGAPRLAIFRGALVESAMLGVAGAVGGIAVAVGLLAAFTSLVPTLPRIDEVRMDWSVLLGAAAVTVLAILAFGLLPAFRLTRVDPQAALRASNRSVTASPASVRVRQALVGVEVALSVGLLTVAGLLLASFTRLDSVERGFDGTNVLTAEIGLPWARYGTDEAALRFWESLREELRTKPGIVEAGITSFLPLRGQNYGSFVAREGERPAVTELASVDWRFVSPGYLQTLGIPLLAGRDFIPNDYARDVAVVSERTARILWGSTNPIGRRFHRGDPTENIEVIGLVPDVHSADLATEPKPIVYTPLTNTGGIVFRTSAIALRTEAEPATAVGALRSAVAALDPELPISRVETMSQIDSSSLGERRFQLWLVGAFAAAALAIAALGVYGVLAYAVATRMHELAMRMTLGARHGSVLLMVLRQGMSPVFVGLVIGLGAALAGGRLLASLLFSVTPTDPATFLSVAAVTTGAALLASLIPAWRATRTPLLAALRYE